MQHPSETYNTLAKHSLFYRNLPRSSEQMFEIIKNSQNIIQNILLQSKCLVYYGKLFSVLSWQVFKDHFQIIILSQFTSTEWALLCGPVCFCYVGCSLETKIIVIERISVLVISDTFCVSVRKKKVFQTGPDHTP